MGNAYIQVKDREIKLKKHAFLICLNIMYIKAYEDEIAFFRRELFNSVYNLDYTNTRAGARTHTRAHAHIYQVNLRTRNHTHTHTHTPTHTHTHARTHARTHTQINHYIPPHRRCCGGIKK
jgi:hypothetical protein